MSDQAAIYASLEKLVSKQYKASRGRGIGAALLRPSQVAADSLASMRLVTGEAVYYARQSLEEFGVAFADEVTNVGRLFSTSVIVHERDRAMRLELEMATRSLEMLRSIVVMVERVERGEVLDEDWSFLAALSVADRYVFLRSAAALVTSGRLLYWDRLVDIARTKAWLSDDTSSAAPHGEVAESETEVAAVRKQRLDLSDIPAFRDVPSSWYGVQL